MTARLNLIPASHLLARKRARRVQNWLVVCGAYGLAAVVAAVCMHVALARDPGNLESGLRDVSQMREKMQLQLGHLSTERKRLTQQYAAARAVGIQPDWSVALRLLGTGGAEGIVLTRLEIAPVLADAGKGSLLSEPEAYQVNVEGLAVSEPALAALVRAIERAGPFGRVRREGSAVEHFRNQQAVRFRLVCELGVSQGSSPAGRKEEK